MGLSWWQLLCLVHPKEVFSWCCQEDAGVFWTVRFWEEMGRCCTWGGHQNPFPAASKCFYFHLSLAVVFPLSSLTPTSQCSQTSFQGHGLGRGKSNFSFLLQLSCKSLDFHIYFPGSLCAIILIRSLLPLLCYSTHTLNLKKKIKAVISYFHK